MLSKIELFYKRQSARESRRRANIAKIAQRNLLEAIVLFKQAKARGVINGDVKFSQFLRG